LHPLDTSADLQRVVAFVDVQILVTLKRIEVQLVHIDGSRTATRNGDTGHRSRADILSRHKTESRIFQEWIQDCHDSASDVRRTVEPKAGDIKQLRVDDVRVFQREQLAARGVCADLCQLAVRRVGICIVEKVASTQAV
jgi:hypothetical protein